MRGTNLPSSVLVAIVTVGVAGVLLWASPVAGNFWWSDAPRHALNGLFVRDLLVAFPIHEPARWAASYYLHYPSLTILFYPPFFYVVEAAAYGIFGATHLTAQATVAAFAVLLGGSTYALAKRLVAPGAALGAAVIVMGAPEVSFWARQVMLDVPAFSLAVCAAVFVVRFVERDRTPDLVGAVLLTLAAIWTKLTVVSVVPAFAFALLSWRGRAARTDRRVWAMGAVGAIGTLPLVWLTARFGAANLESVAGRPNDLSPADINAWLFYGRLLPQYVGWVVLAAAVVGLVALVRRWGSLTAVERSTAILLGSWFVCGYLAFSLIGVKEPRHGLMLVMPLAIAASAACEYLVAVPLRTAAALGLAVATLLYGLGSRPSPRVNGYREVADFVAGQAPPNAVVLFHGTRDGNFVYNLRTRSDRRDIVVLRTDKLFLNVLAGERQRGVRQTDLTTAQVPALIRELGVNLIVIQPGFWTDLPPMAGIERTVKGSDFTRVAVFPISGNMPHEDRLIEVRMPRYEVVRVRHGLTLNMPMMGGTLSGDFAPLP